LLVAQSMYVLGIAVAAALFFLLMRKGRVSSSWGGNLAERLRASKDAEARKRDEQIDEASTQSFPASDPPSFSAAHAGPPSRYDD
jgi:hypothetical protein